MADPAPETEFKADYEAFGRLLHAALGNIVGGLEHIAQTVPAAAGLGGIAARTRQMLERAEGLVSEPPPPPPPPLSDNVSGAQATLDPPPPPDAAGSTGAGATGHAYEPPPGATGPQPDHG